MAITVVQAVSDASNVNSPDTVSFAANVTPGNAILVFGTWGATGAPASGWVTDGGSDTFTSRTSVADSGNGQSVGLWDTPSSAGGFKNVIFTSGAGFNAIVALEVSGLSATPSDTGATHGPVAGSTAANGTTSGSFTPGTSGDLLVAAFMDTVAGSATWAAGTAGSLTWTVPTNGQSGFSLAVEYAIQAAAAAINPSATESAANNYIALGWSYKAGAGGGAQITPPLLLVPTIVRLVR